MPEDRLSVRLGEERKKRFEGNLKRCLSNRSDVTVALVDAYCDAIEESGPLEWPFKITITRIEPE